VSTTPTTTKTPLIILAMTLVIGTMTVGLLLLPLSPPKSLIQSAEATTVSDAGNCFLRTPTIIGTDNDDVIRGTEGRDYIVGLGGNERIYGNGGIDFLCCGNGDDRLHGGEGNDWLNSGAGTDRVFGEDDNDHFFRGAGNDRIYGGPGTDYTDRGKGNDGGDACGLYGNDGNDEIYGGAGAGNDILIGDSSEHECENDDNEPVPCLGGNDEVYGNSGEDELYGNVDDDLMVDQRTTLGMEGQTLICVFW
jgi:Ca2+-binding RTX toxin-like protein